jgi:hypothetical protein
VTCPPCAAAYPRPHSSGTDAVRAALSRLFEGFAVHRGMPERVHVELIGEVWIEPLVREADAGEPLRPRSREALHQAESKYAVALLLGSLFEPFLVPRADSPTRRSSTSPA